MASSKVLASSRNSDLKRKISTPSATDFLSANGRDNNNLVSEPGLTLDGFLRKSYAEEDSSSSDRVHRPAADERNSGTLLNAEITLLDAVGAIVPIRDAEMEEKQPRAVRRTVDDVWREIVEGKKSEKKQQQQQQQPKEEMMTLEDFLVKAGAVEEEDEGKGAIVAVKSEGVYGYENKSGPIGLGMGMGMDVGDLGRGRGKRSMSLLEPLDKAAQQRQRRMIKNRESAARSRERKQAYQVELESMAVRLEEENEQLLYERAERTKKRLKQLMENVIPVVEKRKPPRLRKVRSMQW